MYIKAIHSELLSCRDRSKGSELHVYIMKIFVLIMNFDAVKIENFV